MIPLILVMLVAAVAVRAVGYTFTLAGNAADEAARAGRRRPGDGAAACAAAGEDGTSPAPGGAAPTIACVPGGDCVKATVDLEVPVLFPGRRLAFPVAGRGLAPAPRRRTRTERRAPAGPARGHGRDRGQVALEYLGFLPILLLVALAAVQLGLVAYAVQQAGTAARAAARVRLAGPSADGGRGAGRAAMSDWLADGDIAVRRRRRQVTRHRHRPDPRRSSPARRLRHRRRSATMPLDDDRSGTTARPTEE